MADVVLRTRSALAEILAAVDELEAHIKQLAAVANEALVRAEEAEKRAKTAARDRADAEYIKERVARAEQRLEELTPKVDRMDDLEDACRKMLSALEKLPVKMEDAGMMQTITPPAIPLYGTYEWKAVMNAKFGLIQAMREESK